MSSMRRRKPKKIYQTVIKITPTDGSSEPHAKPKIEIETHTLRPKLFGSRPRLRPPKLKTSTRISVTDFDPKTKFKKVKRYNEALIQRMEWVPVTTKTRWKCVRCGWCCSHDWRVNLTWPEYDRLKNKLPINEVVLDENTGMSHPLFSIRGHCIQYDPKTHKCKIYKDRAYSCATFPFSLTPDDKLVRSKFCKGFGKGDIVNKKKMVAYIIKWRKRAGMEVL